MNDDRERIRKAIDSIEPEEGARERMLDGIKLKAKAEEQRRRMMRSRSLQWLAAAAWWFWVCSDFRACLAATM